MPAIKSLKTFLDGFGMQLRLLLNFYHELKMQAKETCWHIQLWLLSYSC